MKFLLTGNEIVEFLMLFKNSDKEELSMHIKITAPESRSLEGSAFDGSSFLIDIDLILNPEQLPYLKGFKEELSKFKKILQNKGDPASLDPLALKDFFIGHREIRKLLSKFDNDAKLYLEVI